MNFVVASLREDLVAYVTTIMKLLLCFLLDWFVSDPRLSSFFVLPFLSQLMETRMLIRTRDLTSFVQGKMLPVLQWVIFVTLS